MEKQLFTKEEFAKIQSAFMGNFELPIETNDTEGRSVSILCSKNCHPEF